MNITYTAKELSKHKFLWNKAEWCIIIKIQLKTR